MKKWLIITLSSFFVFYILSLRSLWPKPSMGLNCQGLPRFEDYLVPIGREILKAIDLESNKMAQTEMETELLLATGLPVNFAGEYVFVNHECGRGCQKHVLIDTKTNKILYYGLQTSKTFKYAPNSRLINADDRYYEFKNNQLNYLCENEK